MFAAVTWAGNGSFKCFHSMSGDSFSGSRMSNHNRPPPPDIRSLFERIPQLQHTPIIMMPADDLHADRKPTRRKRAGNRHRRISCSRDVISRLHPGNIVFHFDPGNLRRVVGVHVKRKHLVHRQYEVVILSFKVTQTLVKRTAPGLDPR